MIEKIILQHLSNTLQAPCYMEQPERPGGTYVLIEKTGSSEENLICRATFAVQSYAPTMLEAAELNHLVKQTMRTLPAHPYVSKCSLNSDYNYTDTEQKRYRYQAVFDIVHSMEA